jgi:hypothetical protein
VPVRALTLPVDIQLFTIELHGTALRSVYEYVYRFAEYMYGFISA